MNIKNFDGDFDELSGGRVCFCIGRDSIVGVVFSSLKSTVDISIWDISRQLQRRCVL